MKRISIGIVSCLLVGLLAVGLTACSSDSDKESKETTETKAKDESKAMEETTSTMSSQSSSMPNGSMSETYKIDDSKPVPSATITVEKDKMKGYNLNVKVKNFTFAPQNVNNGKDSQNEGHAHIYVNGVKLTRLYGASYYLGDTVAKAGDTVSITLNTNTHKDLVPSNTVTLS